MDYIKNNKFEEYKEIHSNSEKSPLVNDNNDKKVDDENKFFEYEYKDNKNVENEYNDEETKDYFVEDEYFEYKYKPKIDTKHYLKWLICQLLGHAG